MYGKMIRSFKPHESGLEKVLGKLEANVMEIVWASGEVTVRDVFEKLHKERNIAYTTVMTTMKNLAKKGILEVERTGNAYRYRSVLSRQEFMQRVAGEVISGLLDDFAQPMFHHLLDLGKTKANKEVINLLEELVSEAERKQKKGPGER